jgi:hypothetical protein
MVGHGTLIAGLIGAEANNNEGIAGICWNCRIMPLKIHNNQFSRTQSNTALAIKYAADNGADIISMSIGRYTNSNLEEDAAQYAYEKGCIQVCAAGNDNIYKLEDYPLSYDCVIGVAGTNEKDERCDEDDWGSPYGSNYGEVIDVAAPANDIFSTMPTYQVLFNEESWFSLDMNYDYLDGNSFAAPHVAGIAALLLSTSPDLTYEEIRNIISTNVDPYDSEYYIGTGRVNAYKALMGINRNPDIPTIDGPASGAAGEEHEYIFEAIDTDGDDVSYCIDWGDNSIEVCIGPFPSGTEQTSSHIWDEEGTYIIRAKTKDIHGAESDWATFEVSMPKNKALNIQLILNRFFQRFPLFEKILNQIIL